MYQKQVQLTDGGIFYSFEAGKLSIVHHSALYYVYCTTPRKHSLEKNNNLNIVASELKDPICHSNECQIGSFSSEATIYLMVNSINRVVNSIYRNIALTRRYIKFRTLYIEFLAHYIELTD